MRDILSIANSEPSLVQSKHKETGNGIGSIKSFSAFRLY